ncbi:autotransporter outer membrane beta-barrel domain-containing protein [Oxalobacter paraformigenes]|uniref:Outer membrane autotransporter barrel domain-containing protein n=3 Tax=Oxalobacter paraformigenes TaxID=556268 RepID=C3X3U5_9BURK|nr:autotransporter outer membrane beta-barrel domain-containing protein [Oxalobacter paraformigenes]EEO27881.2 outer membrane autotransporter barrel domain-containing protein [Oxalobacter paraformigenes]
MYLLASSREKKKKPAGRFCLTAVAAALVMALPCIAASANLVTVTVDGVVENNIDTDVSSFERGQGAGTVVIDGTGAKHGILADADGHTATVFGNDITVKGDMTLATAMETVRANNKGRVVLGDENTRMINLTGPDTGLLARAGGQIAVQTEKLVISGGNYGIWAQNNTQDPTAPDGAASITIRASDTTITAKESGIVAFSNGKIDISGNLTVNAPTAIEVRGNSTTTINQDGQGTVVLNGDIAFATPGPAQNSGNIIDAAVNINLANADSSWTGSLSKAYPDGNAHTTVDTGVNLALSGGAQWNPVSYASEGASGMQDEELALNRLDLNGGVVNIREAGQEVKVSNLAGTGGTVNIAAKADSTTGTGIKTGTLAIGEVTAGSDAPRLSTRFTGVTADDVNDAAALGAAATAAVTVGDGTGNAGTIAQTATVGEGLVKGEMSATVDENGIIIAQSEAKNTVTDSLQKIGAMNFLSFRAQTNDVSRRMGDLRTMPQADGAWARAIAGQSEYKNIHNTYQTLQIGGDKRIGNFYVGGTASYTDGDGKLHNGTTDDKNWNFGIYGGWINDDGQYIDVIVKRHKLETDFDLHNTSGTGVSGSYDTWGTSASVEYGWRVGIAGTPYYLEPQAEFMIGHLNGVNYRTGAGTDVKQEGIDTAVGRLGLAAGWVSPEKTGSAYIKASVLHDWEGDARTRVSKNGVSRSYTEEMGGTWGEFALGGTWNINKSLAAYGEVETTAGSPVRTTYQVSGGIRYSF